MRSAGSPLNQHYFRQINTILDVGHESAWVFRAGGTSNASDYKQCVPNASPSHQMLISSLLQINP